MKLMISSEVTKNGAEISSHIANNKYHLYQMFVHIIQIN